MDVSYHTMQPCSHYSTAAVQLQQDHTNWTGTVLDTLYALHVSMHLVTTRPNLDFSFVLINDKRSEVRVLSCVEWYGALVLLPLACTKGLQNNIANGIYTLRSTKYYSQYKVHSLSSYTLDDKHGMLMA